MPSATGKGSWTGELLASARTTLARNQLELAVGAGLIFLAAVIALVAQSLEPDDQIVIGNTAGSLTALVEIDSRRIMIGAGASRSHGADLVGRTTRPWARDIELLIISGWDDYHVAGTLGLLERRTVEAIAVIGIPGEAPSWTLLEREAQRQGVPITWVDQAHRVTISEGSTLVLTQTSPADGAWVRLHHHDAQIDFIDARDVTGARPDIRVIPNRSEHALVNMRSTTQPESIDPRLLVLPAPHWQQDFTGFAAPYWAGIDRNQRVTLRLTKDSIRIPLEVVNERPD